MPGDSVQHLVVGHLVVAPENKSGDRPVQQNGAGALDIVGFQPVLRREFQEAGVRLVPHEVVAQGGNAQPYPVEAVGVCEQRRRFLDPANVVAQAFGQRLDRGVKAPCHVSQTSPPK